jgi:hypothetical protein
MGDSPAAVTLRPHPEGEVAVAGFQRAVIHSMRQLISYEPVPKYLPTRSIRIPLTHDACEVCRSKEVTDEWNR